MSKTRFLHNDFFVFYCFSVYYKHVNDAQIHAQSDRYMINNQAVEKMKSRAL
jgi:hypothetical protein